MKSSRSMAALAIIACCSYLCSCSRSPILVGFSGSITGRQSALGLEGFEAVRMAVDGLNAAGGVRGRPVELVVREDGSDALLAARNQRELEGLGVVATIGPSTSSMGAAALAATPGSTIPIVAGTISSDEFSGKRDRFFTVVNNSLSEVEALGDELGRRGVKAVTLVQDVSNAAYSGRWAAHAARSFGEKGITVAGSTEFDSRAVQSYGAVAEEALAYIAGSADSAVGIVAGGVDTALVAQAIRTRGYQGLLASSAWGKTPDLLEHGGRAVEGMLFLENYNADSRSERFVDFAAEYQKRYGRAPNFSAANHYEAALFLFEGLRRARRDTGLLEALRSIDRIEGLQGVIKFDEYGDAHRSLSVLRVRGGAFELSEGR